MRLKQESTRSSAPAAAVRGTTSFDFGVLDDADGRSCLLLPYTPFPGQKHPLLIGEVQLQEMEDDMESRTQLFLLEDGSVQGGATDGPPPEAMCGFWQCGDYGFQMTLQRTFQAGASMNSDGTSPEYTVTRVYLGSVNQESDGMTIVEGRMVFYDTTPEQMQAPFPVPKQGGDDNYVINLGASAIGYFNIDALVEEANE